VKGAGRPLWEDLASADDVAVLDPGLPARWPDTPDVLVVGGGAIGLGIAVMCTRAGMDVLLVERGRLADGASGRAAGGLSPDAHPELGPQWQPVAAESLRLHRELDREWDYGLRTVDIVVGEGFVIPAQSHADPLRMCAAFARRAGTIATGVEVTGVERDTVHTTNGVVRPANVVFATGDVPDEAAVAQSWVKGHLIATEPAPFEIEGILAPRGVQSLVLQMPSGHVIAGGTKEPGIDTPDVDDAVVAQIVGELATIHPEASRLQITHRWTCFRPRLDDELPVVDRLPGSGVAWVAAGFYSTGILMAPVVGAVVAEWISSDKRPAGAEPFGLERLAR
jgi:glycine/D-amino acid oxidase-like deaminating enzyme